MIAKVRLRELTAAAVTIVVVVIVDEFSAPLGVLLGVARRSEPGLPPFPFSLPLSLLQDTRVNNLMENCELQSASAPIFRLASARLASRTRGTLHPSSLHLRETPALVHLLSAVQPTASQRGWPLQPRS